MKALSFEDRILHELKDLYSAEKLLVKALPRVAEAAEDSALREALHEVLATSRENVARLTRIRKELGIKLAGHTCNTTAQGLEEAWALIHAEPGGPARDVGLVTAVERIEHHKITRYTEARILAERLGLGDAARLLSETIAGKRATVESLIGFAESCGMSLPGSPWAVASAQQAY